MARKLIAEKMMSAKRTVGGPRKATALVALIVRMATENRDWGNRRIQGALSNLGHAVAHYSRQYSEAAPIGTSTGAESEDNLEGVLDAALGTGCGGGLLHRGSLDASGLQRFLVLFFLDLSTRRVKIVGIGFQVNGLWMSQIARDLSDSVDGQLMGKQYLIHDRDPLFTAEFQNMLAEVGIESVKLPPRSPNLNAHAERFVRTIKESCLDRLILFGEGSLCKVIREFVAHYHVERNHQGLDNQLITAETTTTECHGAIRRRQRLGGMLNYYHRAA
jgi:putative transposase